MAGRTKRRQTSGLGSNILLSLVLITFIFTLAVVIILNFKWLYYADITLLGIEKESGMDVSSIKANYDALIEYNRFWFRGELKFPNLIMSETGRIHFREVKQIFVVIQYLCMITFVASLIGIIKKKRRGQYGYLKITGLLSFSIPVVAGISALLYWYSFFALFHKILFRNNYWLFDSKTDPVILILPDAYFMHCAIGILLIIFLAGMICLKLDKRKRQAAAIRRRRK